MDCKRQSNDRQARNRIQVLNRIIKRPALEQRLVDVREGAAEQNGVAVRAGASDRGGTQGTAAAADVFDDHRAEQRFDLLHPWPGEGVERATRRKWNHESDRPRRVVLCPSEVRDGRERGSARGEMQKSTARQGHGVPPQAPAPDRFVGALATGSCIVRSHCASSTSGIWGPALKQTRTGTSNSLATRPRPVV